MRAGKAWNEVSRPAPAKSGKTSIGASDFRAQLSLLQPDGSDEPVTFMKAAAILDCGGRGMGADTAFERGEASLAGRVPDKSGVSPLPRCHRSPRRYRFSSDSRLTGRKFEFWQLPGKNLNCGP